MKRLAILIGSPFANAVSTPPNPVFGVKDDVLAWTYFLNKPVGGCWDCRYEILDASTYTWKKLKDICQNDVKHVDYVFFVYSGHGFSPSGEDSVFLSNGLEIVEDQEIIDFLTSFADRGTIIFDACRNTTPVTKLESGLYFTQSMLEQTLAKDVATVRSYWESKFPPTSSGNGFVIIKSCDNGEKSYMMRNASGSVYCTKMINTGLFSEVSISVLQAFDDAAQQTTDEVKSWGDTKKQQHPQRYGVQLDYPFCLGTREILNVQANGWI